MLTAIDIGSSKIKGLVAEQKKDGTLAIISAFKHPSSGFRKGVLVDIEDANQTIRELMRELRQFSKQAVKNVFINLNSEHVKVRISRGISAVSQPEKEIKQEDVERAIQSSKAAKMLPNYKILHTMIREYVVDDIGDIQDPVGMTGSRLEVSTLLVEAFAPHFDMLGRAFEEAGANVNGIIFNPFASAKAVLTKKQKVLGVVLIDLGGETTSLSAFEEGKPLYARSFPIGCSHITNDIAVGLKAPVDAAERIKLYHGTAFSRGVSRKDMIQLGDIDPTLSEEISKRYVSEIIEVRVAEILDILNNELKSLRERFEFPAGIVITGGGVKLEGIKECIRETMRLPVQIGLPNMANIEIQNPAHEKLIDDPEFAVAVGLLHLNGAKGERKPMNIFGRAKRFVRNIVP